MPEQERNPNGTLVRGLTSLDEVVEYIRPRPDVGDVMTNFDHSIEDGAEESLRAGSRGVHAAWEFNGNVWYEESDGLFHEIVHRFHVPVGHFAAESLRELMEVVNDECGWS
jgi:hypothetical protein